MKLNIEKLKEIEGCKETLEYIEQFDSFILGIKVANNEKFSNVEVTKRDSGRDMLLYNVSASYDVKENSYFNLFIKEQNGVLVECYINVRSCTDRLINIEQIKSKLLEEYGIIPKIFGNKIGYLFKNDNFLTSALISSNKFVDMLILIYEEMFEGDVMR
ncbi:gp492 [Bacillus phage G]|uniref:Gp492 n=1 Tax=Bacillus phage G TaxID=2884420 RepID=G3MAN3_9CAUD|nr:gp492 [Bacillus phage G]AEO93750.1 gp492 [Bacillus phage G]